MLIKVILSLNSMYLLAFIVEHNNTMVKQTPVQIEQIDKDEKKNIELVSISSSSILYTS